MKGGVAMMLAALLRAKAEGLTPPGDVVLAIVSDEEVGGRYGARYLVEKHPVLFKGIRYAIGEFGGFTLRFGRQRFYPIMVAEKQPCLVRATVRGPSGHGSLPMHGGATAKLGKLLQQLDKDLLPVHITPVVRQMIEKASSALPLPAKLALRLLLTPFLTDKVLNLLSKRGEVFGPLFHNTVNVTTVHGGEQIWGIPSKIVVELASSLLPGYNSNDLMAELRQIIGDDIELELINYDPGPAEPEMGLFKTLADILREADPDGIPIPILMPGPSDGRHFSQLDIQTYGFLPMNLPSEFDFSQTMHAADERIPVKALAFGTNIIYKVLQRF
jgi:acetylornithine deacetylase/succinyl-diaminopimelate desuccinylase-like protein